MEEESWRKQQKKMRSMSCSENSVVAPFVAKTYEMVSEGRTDGLIRWGQDNNSFVVLDAADFSLLLLPSYFKHSNFASFVRQLNTYGFKKVDPDRWEFAHESFLRGQSHLLPLITRRKKRFDDNIDKNPYITTEDEDDNRMLLQEVGRLRREQKALDEELQGLSKRLQVTERRPHQMISFLVKVAADPDLLPRLILSKKEQQRRRQQQQLFVQEKKARLFDSTNSLPPLPQSFNLARLMEDSSICNMQHGATSDEIIQSATSNLFVDDDNCEYSEHVGVDHQVGGSETKTVAYPFSLLGHIFF